MQLDASITAVVTGGASLSGKRLLALWNALPNVRATLLTP
jgi:hypothetical protein